ncbi:MAG: ABC-F family ATP-binding cassette domain-containing protein [Candidatus Algichlamydia australiensis]|nr:ABC-F family ATP-binding cassette domain-containing protein [Chlamydiales bacterium]
MRKLLAQLINISIHFDSITLFEEISLSIHEGEIFALVGENGTGKSTLLKLLSGVIAPDKGKLSKASHLRVGLMPQEADFPESLVTARTFIETGIFAEMEEQMAICLNDPNRLDEWSEIHERYEQLGGYSRLPVEKVLGGLKLDSSLYNLPVSSLSGGQKARILLAKALIDNPDLLLLDEPTNHLDREMLDWLEKMLKNRVGATIVVSHDRKFLNAICNRLIEIKDGNLNSFGGNYDFYLEEKKRALEREIKAFEKQEEEKTLLKQKIKATNFSQKKARPPKDRNFMAYDKRGEKHQKSLQRNLNFLKAQLAEIEANPLPHPKPKTIKGLRFEQTPLTSRVAIELEEVSKTFGEKTLFSDVNKVLSKGSRILLTGPNGSGKTTLLKCIAGLLPFDSGQVRYAPTAKVAYLDQEANALPLKKTPLGYFEERYNLIEEKLRSELHKAAIGGAELLSRPFSTQSPGQRKRFMLLSLILERPNILLLDEPTNHLDLLTLEAFETSLLHFEGTILAVSHDATFIEKIATEEWSLY